MLGNGIPLEFSAMKSCGNVWITFQMKFEKYCVPQLIEEICMVWLMS
jgi:hypothetical protein